MTHSLHVRQVLVCRPVLCSGAADEAEDLVDLLDLALAWEQRGVQDELAHDAPHAPHVNGC